MRCTRCGETIRPVVSVDIDGTLGNYHLHFREFAQNYLGRSLRANFRGGEFNEYLGIDKKTYRDIKLAYRQGSLKRWLPIYDGAQEFMDNLREIGVEIWIATHRPWLRLDNIDPDTRHWLDRYKIPFDGIIFGEDKYDQLIERVDVRRIVAVVDDLKEDCERATRLHLPVFQITRPHNRGENLYAESIDFEWIGDTISSRVTDWREVMNANV